MEHSTKADCPHGGERRVINPHRAFVGPVTPLWLIRRTEITQGAKLCYARLAMYAGANGRCFPRQETLAAELGATKRGARRYIEELVDAGLIESVKKGFHSANEYLFLHHEWMEIDGHKYDGLNIEDGQECDGLLVSDGHKRDGLDVEDRHKRDAKTVMNVTEVRESVKRLKISGSVKRDSSNSEAERVYEHYVTKVRAGARADAIRNIKKLLKDHPAAELIAAVDRYAGNGMPADQQYRIQANNFFGKAARYEEYLHEAAKPSSNDPDELRRLN